MKKFNKNSLVFLFTILFIIVGFSGSALPSLMESFSTKISAGERDSTKSKMTSVWNVFHDSTDECLSYFTNLMDLNSLKENLLGTKMMKKSDETIIKSNSEQLSVLDYSLSDEEIHQTVDNINRLKIITENSGARFLYCTAPNKEYYETFHQNFSNVYGDNYSRFLHELQVTKTPYISFADLLSKTCENENDVFCDG